MGRIMAIDYGKQRVGLAVTDPSKIIATPLAAVRTPEVLSFLQQYLQREDVEALVVGLPKRLDNTASDMTKTVNTFIKSLKKHFPEQRIFEQDERYTSKIAQDSLVQGGFKQKDRRHKEHVDKLSATLILQSFLKRLNRDTL